MVILLGLFPPSEEVLPGMHVARVLFNGTRASGVEVVAASADEASKGATSSSSSRRIALTARHEVTAETGSRCRLCTLFFAHSASERTSGEVFFLGWGPVDSKRLAKNAPNFWQFLFAFVL